MSIVQQKLEVLDGILVVQDAPDFVPRFDEAVAQLRDLDDPNLIEALMARFDDAVDVEVMFGMLHAVEQFADDPALYIDHFVRGLPALLDRSTQWADSLLAAILNSPPTLGALHDRIGQASDAERRALGAALEHTVTSGPEFTDRAHALLRRLRSP